MNFQSWFRIGMKREIAEFLPAGERILEIGGKTVIDSRLYRPFWDAKDGLYFIENGSIDTVFANHFLEHLSGEDALQILREIERILTPRGTANLVTPYYNSQMQFHDLDHRSAWNERTWANIFNNPYYDDKGGWQLEVHACFIVGIVERNLALFTQLVKR